MFNESNLVPHLRLGVTLTVNHHGAAGSGCRYNLSHFHLAVIDLFTPLACRNVCVTAVAVWAVGLL